ncbi:transcription factor bHLH101-like [Chenopodium quinoa]|uniref:BHLH domain-containing protein n=1 Tax=Chenopodium quinoa TaxID=63459 RepID=A0A803MM22_CHEQI|nr:transcription factor bHLH101-like [Chenopodium quinoa]
MCPFVPTLGLEYAIELELETYDQVLLDNNYLNLDAIFLPNILLSQAQDDSNDHVKLKQRKSSLSTSSADHQFGAAMTTTTTTMKRKINHNASERDRRKKINVLYSSLRDLLPANDQIRRLSIPATVARVLKYIPELQEEVKDLTHRKEELLSEISVLQGNNTRENIHEEKPKMDKIKEKSTSFSVSMNNLSDKEMVIQISTLFERVSLSEVLILLEKNGNVIIDVSSFQSFGGRFFYNIHLWLEENYVVNYDKLNEELLSLFQKQKQKLSTPCR